MASSCACCSCSWAAVVQAGRGLAPGRAPQARLIACTNLTCPQPPVRPQAYFKMNNVLIDDRRIKVDFSQVGTQSGQPGCARNAAAVGTKPGHQGVPICHGSGLRKGSSWPVVHALNSPSAAAPQAGRSCGKLSEVCQSSFVSR